MESHRRLHPSRRCTGPPLIIVAGDLHVADEDTGVGHRYLGAPSDAVVSGAAYDQGACTYVKVVPGNVHVSEVRRGGIVVSPARLPVVAAGGVNTKMSPASRVQRIGGLVSAQCAAPVAVEPDGEPGAGWAVVQNNGVAKCIVKGALTGRVGDAGEGGAAVRGARYAREVVKVLAPRESLKATQTWSGLSGLAVVNVSDCVVLGGVSYQ